ncbi:MAG: hypothetical protein AAF447_07100 [Myxococcota bacterium]
MSLESFINTAPPRDARQVATHIRTATRGYRQLALLMWAITLGVSLLVGLTSKDGEKLSTFIFGLVMSSVMFGLPVQAFAFINRRKILRSLEKGVRLRARVVNVKRRGTPGRKIDEVEVAIQHQGQTKRAFASGLVPPHLGDGLDALYDPAAPDTVALVIPEMGLVIARVS